MLFRTKLAAFGINTFNSIHWVTLSEYVNLHSNEVLDLFLFSSFGNELTNMVSKRVQPLAARE